MRQQNGQEYSASSVRAAIAAIRRHLIDNSAIKGVDVQQESLFPNLWKVFNGKIKYLSDFGLNEPKGSDALTVDEIIQILNHQKMDSSTPRRLLYRIFFYNAILLGLRGGEHSSLMVDDFKKRPDGGFDVWIFRSKANQRVNTNHRGKGEKLILPNNPILINDYDRYIDLRPVNAEPNFYLQEFEEETGKLKSH
jgi:integrase